jgi:hypothetical protein
MCNFVSFCAEDAPLCSEMPPFLLILHHRRQSKDFTEHMSAFAQTGAKISKPAELDVDIGEFFSLPIHHVAWNQTKSFRDLETIRYVEALLKWQQTILIAIFFIATKCGIPSNAWH